MALPSNCDQLVRLSRSRNGNHTITVGGHNKSDPFPFDEPVTISISSSGVELIGTATDEAAELLADYLTCEPTTITALREAMGENAPTDDALRNALKAWIAQGRAVLVSEGRGNKGSTYRV